MEDTAEFKWAVKVVLRRQLRDLVDQLQETGDEVAVMTVNTSEDVYSHFGTSTGEWFISEQRNLTSSFLNFCKTRKTKRGEKRSLFTGYDDSETAVLQPPTKKATKTIHLGASATVSKPTTPQKEVAEVLEVHIPIKMKEGISDVAIESLVGRLVAYIMAKDPANKDPSLPSISRRGRKIKPKVIEDAGLTKPTTPEGQKILESLGSIDTQILKRVQVKIGSGSFANVASTPIPTSEEMYSLAVSLMDELLLLENYLMTKRTQLKVVVAFGKTVKTEIVKKLLQDIREDQEEPYFEAFFDENNEAKLQEFDDDETGIADGDNNEEMETELDSTYVPPVNKEGKPAAKLDEFKKHIKRRKRKAAKFQRSIKRTMKIPCDHCGLLLTGAYHLKDHIQYVHMKIRKAVCKVCNKGFWSQSMLNGHMFDVHTRQCQACKEYVVESEPWKEGTNNRMVRMAQCKCGTEVPVSSLPGRKSTAEGQNRKENESKPQNDKGAKYVCGFCGKIFTNKRRCETHAKSHAEQKDFICDLCGKSFGYEVSLRKHLLNEHSTLQHICEVCGCAYTSEQSLQNHVAKTHRIVELDANYDVDKEIAKKVQNM